MTMAASPSDTALAIHPDALAAGFTVEALRRIETHGLNASGVPQQWWLDGWLLRANPGKAKRSRCVNAVSAGHGDLPARLDQVQAFYAARGLPCFIRITPFSEPAGLDATLAARGWRHVDDTRVLVRPGGLAVPAQALDLAGLRWQSFGTDDFAHLVGALRGSPVEQVEAHAERLRHSPVPYRGFAWVDAGQGQAVACGQYAAQDGCVGLYDVHTHPHWRGRGLAAALCGRLLQAAAAAGAGPAYLQVEADNAPAWRIYRRLGFVEAYAYHYRQKEVDS